MSPAIRSITMSSRRRAVGGGGGGGGLTFESVGGTVGVRDYASPAAAQAAGLNMKPFSTLAGLNSALSTIAAGDYIYYNGTGVLTITSSSANGFTLASKKPTGLAYIDFGTRQSVWNPELKSTNYCEFSYTGSSNLHGMYVHDNSNLRIYGGSFTTNLTGGRGIWFIGGNTNVHMVDFYSHDCGGDGIGVMPTFSGSGGSNITNCVFRGEMTNWGHNLNLDPHPEKGTGLHGCQFADIGSGGSVQGCVLSLYTHDGPTGAGIQIGQSGGGPITPNTFYIKAVNLGAALSGTTWTGKAQSETAGNAIQFWGNDNVASSTIGWAEGSNLQGAVVWASDLSSSLISGLVVDHGRHLNVNQNTNGTSGSVPFDTSRGIVYNDIDYP